MNVDLYGIIRMILIYNLIKKALRLKVQPTFTQASVFKLEIDESFVKMIENDYIVVEVQIFCCILTITMFIRLNYKLKLM